MDFILKIVGKALDILKGGMTSNLYFKKLTLIVVWKIDCTEIRMDFPQGSFMPL